MAEMGHNRCAGRLAGTTAGPWIAATSDGGDTTRPRARKSWES